MDGAHLTHYYISHLTGRGRTTHEIRKHEYDQVRREMMEDISRGRGRSWDTVQLIETVGTRIITMVDGAPSTPFFGI